MSRPARQAFDTAHSSLEHLIEESPDDERLINSLGYDNARLGNSQDEADSAVRSMRSRQRAGLEISDVAGRILAQANLPDLAIPYLEVVLEANSLISAQTLRMDPLLDPIRDDPAFQTLVE